MLACQTPEHRSSRRRWPLARLMLIEPLLRWNDNDKKNSGYRYPASPAPFFLVVCLPFSRAIVYRHSSTYNNETETSMRLTKRFGLLAAAAAFTASTAAVAAPSIINILTGGTSGVYYPIGVALSQQYNKIEGAKTSAQATNASVQSLNLPHARRGELALSLGDSADDASNGVEDAGFKAPLKRLRAIAATYPTYLHIVASKESGIKTPEHLTG